jgi:hypothetical protein
MPRSACGTLTLAAARAPGHGRDRSGPGLCLPAPGPTSKQVQPCCIVSSERPRASPRLRIGCVRIEGSEWLALAVLAALGIIRLDRRRVRGPRPDRNAIHPGGPLKERPHHERIARSDAMRQNVQAPSCRFLLCGGTEHGDWRRFFHFPPLGISYRLEGVIIQELPLAQSNVPQNLPLGDIVDDQRGREHIT